MVSIDEYYTIISAQDGTYRNACSLAEYCPYLMMGVSAGGLSPVGVVVVVMVVRSARCNVKFKQDVAHVRQA